MLARFQKSDGLGAIFPPVVFSTVALKALGYADDSPEVVECLRQLDRLAIDDPGDGTTRLQPCFSPVWDTGLVMRALAVAGVPADDPAIVRAADWLRSRQTTAPGDWAETVDAPPGGWYFEYANEFYPDVDDTAMSLMALQTLFRDGEETRCRGVPAGQRTSSAAERLGRCRSSAACAGCWPCRIATAAGARSTATTIATSSAMCPLPITTP